jgi:hypothetical protein
MTEFWLWLGDIITDSFVILTASENIPNYAFIAIGILLFVYWMIELYKYKKNDVIE